MPRRSNLFLNWITAGDISADGQWLVLRNDRSTDYARIWHKTLGVPWNDVLLADGCLFGLQNEPQGEAIAWDAQSGSFFTVSEAHHDSEPIWRYTE